MKPTLEFSEHLGFAQRHLTAGASVIDERAVAFSASRDGFTVAFQRLGDDPANYSNRIYVYPAASGDLATFGYPHDPELPAFKIFAEPISRVRVLERLFENEASRDIQLLSYRPLRRAIFRISTAESSYYLKVVKPAKVDGVVQRHQHLSSLGLPVPEVIWWSPAGAMIIRGLPGQTYFEALLQSDFNLGLGPWHEARRLLQAQSNTSFKRPSAIHSTDWAITALARLYPNRVEDLRTIGAKLKHQHKSELAQPTHPTVSHGDLHYGQILVATDSGKLSAILDLDSFGIGSPADDIAAFGSQLAVYVRSLAHRGANAKTYLEKEWDEWLSSQSLEALNSIRARIAFQLSLLALSQSNFESGSGEGLLDSAFQVIHAG